MSFFNSLFGVRAQNTDHIKIIDVIAFKSAIYKKDIQLIDVRTPREFNASHIAKAINVDFYQQNQFVDKFSKLDKNRPVYLYCRSGSRSQKAARRLVKMGFTEVFDLKGGFLNWK